MGVFLVGKQDFDRWANSRDLEFDLLTAKGQRKFRRYCDEQLQEFLDL